MISPKQLFENLISERVFSEALEELLFEHRFKISDLVQIQLEQFGVDGNNQLIEPFYTPFTVRIKQSKGQRTDHVTLKDTGDFHNSIFIEFEGAKGTMKRAIVTNTTDKALANDLAKKYGEAIIDLNDNSVEQIIDDIIIPFLPQKLIKKWLTTI
jgi:hypothetical protein